MSMSIPDMRHVEDLCPLARGTTVHTPFIFLFLSQIYQNPEKDTGQQKYRPPLACPNHRTFNLFSDSGRHHFFFFIYCTYSTFVFQRYMPPGKHFLCLKRGVGWAAICSVRKGCFCCCLLWECGTRPPGLGVLLLGVFFPSSFAYNGWSFMLIQGWCFGWGGYEEKGSVGKVFCFSPHPRNARRSGLRPRRLFFFFFIWDCPPVLSTTVHTKRQNQHGEPGARRKNSTSSRLGLIPTSTILDFRPCRSHTPGLDG